MIAIRMVVVLPSSPQVECAQGGDVDEGTGKIPRKPVPTEVDPHYHEDCRVVVVGRGEALDTVPLARGQRVVPPRCVRPVPCRPVQIIEGRDGRRIVGC